MENWADYLRTELILGGFTCSGCGKKLGPSTTDKLVECSCGGEWLITEGQDDKNTNNG